MVETWSVSLLTVLGEHLPCERCAQPTCLLYMVKRNGRAYQVEPKCLTCAFNARRFWRKYEDRMRKRALAMR